MTITKKQTKSIDLISKGTKFQFGYKRNIKIQTTYINLQRFYSVKNLWLIFLWWFTGGRSKAFSAFLCTQIKTPQTIRIVAMERQQIPNSQSCLHGIFCKHLAFPNLIVHFPNHIDQLIFRFWQGDVVLKRLEHSKLGRPARGWLFYYDRSWKHLTK